MELNIKKYKKNYSVLIDDEDWKHLSKYKWHLSRRGLDDFYVRGWIGGQQVLMHRFIMKTPEGMLTDHINGNGLDNRRSNLRICTYAENNVSRGPLNNLKLKGVRYRNDWKKWRATIYANKKNINLGHYDKRKDAIRAYNEAAKKYHGEYAYLNPLKNGLMG